MSPSDPPVAAPTPHRERAEPPDEGAPARAAEWQPLRQTLENEIRQEIDRLTAMQRSAGTNWVAERRAVHKIETLRWVLERAGLGV